MPIPIKPLTLSGICLATLLVTMSGQQATLVAKPAAAPQKAPAPLDQAAQLKSTIEKLDAASKRFKSASANIHNVFHNRLTGDEVQDGKIYFERTKLSTEMGLFTTGRDARMVHFEDGVLRVYNPSAKHCDLIHRPGIDTYLTIGFGGSGTDLAKAWHMTDLGADKIDGVAVEKLDLVPIDASVASNVAKLTLWVDLSRAISLKQVLQDPSGDSKTATYSQIVYNQKINTKPFKFDESLCK